MRRADFLLEPTLFVSHTPQREFMGPGLVSVRDGAVLMAAPWGRPPVDFSQSTSGRPGPHLYRSNDGGRNWTDLGLMNLQWHGEGVISDGGITLLPLQDGRLGFLGHRLVEGLHGGGLPVWSVSDDEGETWAPARRLDGPEGTWYVMNDRMIQTRTGRLLVPVAHMEASPESLEGSQTESLCFYSDDAGKTWKHSACVRLEDERGLQEPCISETAPGEILMLARTGSRCHHACWSADDGETWSPAQPTSLTAACSPLTLRTLPDGRLIVFYNHAEPIETGAFFPRTPLCYALSDDRGATWSPPTVIDSRGSQDQSMQHIYPGVCFTDEGILVVYSTHAADAKGSFGMKNDPALHGGMRALLRYPD